jgi:hypothetical protein
MRAKIVELPSHKSFPPHCCIVSGRRDRPMVDFGDPNPKACGPGDPRVYVSVSQVEYAARELLGMKSQKQHDEICAELEEANAEAGRLRKIVAAGEEMSAAEDRLREALDPGPDAQTDN